MNYFQFGLFLVYAVSVFIIGIAISVFLNNAERMRMNRFLYIGEAFLLGSIVLVGELLILSLIGLYRAPYLWGAVLLNYAFILKKEIRSGFVEALYSKSRIDFPTIIFILLLVILIFRNCYFLIDVDSLSTYLFTQKLWLSSGTSLIGSVTNDMRIFVPQFEAVPYSLGIAIFGQEALFPQLINLFWRLIAVFLIFGYTTYRFNSYYGLAAAVFVIFNDHFFYSGANQWVTINGAVIALLFGAVYNFWEARKKNEAMYITLALIFLSQLMSNKYYLFFIFLFLLIGGIAVQIRPFEKIKEILKCKKYTYAILIALLLMSLSYIKNFIITGDPAFPLFAGRLHVFGWTIEKQKVYSQFVGGIGMNPLKLIKYMSYLFIWPGINSAKYTLISIIILPFTILVYSIRQKIDREEVIELCFWLGVSILLLFGLCLAVWQHPRYYRFLICLFSFATILSLRFIIKYVFGIKNEFIFISVILLFAFQGYSIINQGGAITNRPTIKENVDILLNRMRMNYIIKKHHPEVYIALKGLTENKDKINSSAWFNNINGFLLPDRPVVSLLYSTTIKWDSYSNENLIVNDLNKMGIKWIMTLRDNRLIFLTAEEFAKEAIKFDRQPKKIEEDYGFPEELTRIN